MSANDDRWAGGIPARLRAAAAKYGALTAVHTFGQEGVKRLDFATFDRLSDRAAAGLHRGGVEKGDRVGLYCVNSDAFAIAYAGILKAGATVVPLNLLLHAREIEYISRDADARALIYHEAFAGTVAEILPALPDVTLRVAIGSAPAPVGELAWADLLAGDDPAPEVELDPAADLAAILYTSGTTGQPKGAMLTHRNLLANTTSVRQALHIEPGEDSLLVVLPMFHSFAATVGMLLPLLHGCGIVPLPRFEPDLLVGAIAATRATIFLGVPSMYALLARLPDEQVARCASIRLCVSGGAALPSEVLRKFEERFGIPIHEGDGPTECSPVTCVNPIGGVRKIGTVGVAIPGVEMRIVGADGHRLATGQVGEICVRGDNVMKGYWKRPEETRECFFDEWFRTGDLGTEDEDGYFTIVDRIKDMIIVNGVNVYPRVIEDVLYGFGPIREAAVVGEPHDLHGEIPIAFVALEEGASATDDDVRAFCRDHLGRHQVPRKVHFVDALPRNAGGKVLKRQLRKQGELERGVDSR